MMKQKIKRNLSYFLSAVMMVTAMGITTVASAANAPFLDRDFSTAQEDGWPVENTDTVSEDGLIRDTVGTSKLAYPLYDETEGALVATKNSHADGGTYGYGALMYGTNTAGDDILDLTGNVVFEAKMKFTNMNATMWPFVFTPDITVNSFGQARWYGKNFPKDGFKVTNSKCYVDGVELCDINANEYYTFRVAANIDGDVSTVDEMTCTVTDKDGNLYIATAKLDSNETVSAMSSVKSVSIIRYNNGTGSDATTYIKSIKGYTVDSLPTVDFSLSDNASDVEGGTDVTLTFDTDMDTTSFENIVLKVNGSKVTDLAYQATDAKTCVITLPETLASSAACKLEVPKTVISKDGFSVEDTLTFTAKATTTPPAPPEEDEDEDDNTSEEFLINRDFSTAQEDGWPVENTDTVSEDGLVRDVTGTAKLTYPSYDAEEEALVATVASHNDGGTYAYGALMYGVDKAGKDLLDLTGNLVFEAKMKFTNIEATMLPFVFTPSVTSDSFGKARWYGDNLVKDGFRVTNGKCYVDGVELCNILANEYYTFKVSAAIDGDINTIDTMICTVTDKDGKSYQATARLDSNTVVSNMDSIKSVSIIRYNNASGSNATTYIKTLKAWIVPSPEFTATVADGDADVELLNEIELTFDQDMNADGFSKIKLYDWNEKAVNITVSPTEGTAKVCTVTINDKLLNNRAYKLVIPAVTSVDGIASKATEINFTTKPKDALIAIGTPVVNGGGVLHVTSGSNIAVKALISNKTANPQEGCVIIGIYNSENRLKKIGYTKESLAANAENVPVEATVTVPDNIGDGAYIRVFGWDSLESMNAGIDMLILPQ